MKSAAPKHNLKFGNEASRRLYRGAADSTRKLEQHLNLINSLSALFSSETTDLRMRLKEFCERLIFTDPVEYGKRAEDLLWRKVYYDFFFRCKQNKKKLLESDNDRRALINQLLASIGFYHHLLLRIQTEFHVNLEGKVDVPLLWQLKGIKKERWKKYQQSAANDVNVKTWAEQATHRILIYLGDLARYLAELDETESHHLAERYYQQAFCMNSLNGTPHNQLGSLYANRFESAYHYMRCLMCQDKFDGAEGNLMRTFEKNDEIMQQLYSVELTDKEFLKSSRFLSRFLKLCQMFYFTSGEKTEIFCQDILKEFDMTLNCNSNNDSSIHLTDDIVFKIVVMSLMCIFKLQEKVHSDTSVATAFCLALFSHIVDCATRRLLASLLTLKEVDESVENGIKKEMGNNLVKNGTTSKELSSDASLDSDMSKDLLTKKNHNKKLGLKKFTARRLRTLRRRRKMSSTSQEDSELSEGEMTDLLESDEESGLLNSDISQTGSCSSESMSENEDDLLVEEEEEEEEEENSFSNEGENDVAVDKTYCQTNGCSNTFINGSDPNDNALQKKNYMNNVLNILDDPLVPVEKYISILKKNTLLQCLKILSDWLRINEDILSACAESSKFLLLRLIELLNMLLKIESKLQDHKEINQFQQYGESWSQKFPLPEDIALQGFSLLKGIHSQLSFGIIERRKLSSSSQVFIRIQCLLSFGKCLIKASESSVDFDAEKNKYFFNLCNKTKDPNKEDTSIQKSINSDMETQKQKFMRSMAHLWLKAEVNDLETLVEGGSSPQLSPYLVVDTSVLCCNLVSLKQLVFSKRFIIVIPQVVIQNLDQLKKDSIGAREAIRWLESELRKGCRYIRAQREVEKRSLVPMKYPKKKDKDAWEFYQILECCNYLVEQQSSGKSDSPLVTLLVGSLQHLPDNANAVAHSIDITIEKLRSFISKWRSSSKNPG